MQSYVVYHAKCTQCNSRQDYIGSSRQYLHERVKQHYTRPEEAIHLHNRATNHSGQNFSYKILAKCDTLKELLFTEAILIKKLQPTLNRRHEQEDVTRFIV